MDSIFSFHYYFFNPHLRIWLSILEKEGRENETSVWERNIDWLPPVHASTGDWTHNLLVYQMTFQPTDPPSQVCIVIFYFRKEEHKNPQI